MKKFKYLFIMFVAVMVSVSCINDDDDNDPNGGADALVGTWGFTESEEGIEIDVTATFKANLSGTIVSKLIFQGEQETETESFTWSTDGNKLTLVISGESETSTYSISGDELTLTFDDEVIVLTRK